MGQREIINVRLALVGAEYLGVAPEDVTVNDDVIPHGFGLRAGEISPTSSVRSVIPDGFSLEKRVEFTARVQDTWTEVSGQTANDMVAGAAEWYAHATAD